MFSKLLNSFESHTGIHGDYTVSWLSGKYLLLRFGDVLILNNSPQDYILSYNHNYYTGNTLSNVLNEFESSYCNY